MTSPLAVFWRKVFPPRITDDALRIIEREAAETVGLADEVAAKFERISDKAKATGLDPLAVLVHEVKAASVRRAASRQ